MLILRVAPQARRSLDQRQDGGFLLKEPKSRHGRRVVTLPSFCVVALHEHRKRMLAEGQDVHAGTIFVTKTGNHIGKSNFVRTVHQPLLEQAKIPYRRFHTFRHTHASQLLASGVNPVDMARRLGDKVETIMRAYAHWIPTGGDNLADKVENLYRQVASNQ